MKAKLKTNNFNLYSQIIYSKSLRGKDIFLYGFQYFLNKMATLNLWFVYSLFSSPETKE